MMRRIRGFKIGNKLIRVSRWIFFPRSRPGYSRLAQPKSSSTRPYCKLKPITKLIEWGRRLAKPGRWGYLPVGYEKPVRVPKGHLAVYVGEKEKEKEKEEEKEEFQFHFQRVLVPVKYVNHPLFSELLKEAEKEYGFNHQHGGIIIPCGFSQFQRVQTHIMNATTASG